MPISPRIVATTPALPDREGGRCSSVVTPRNVWIGTPATAQNAVSFTTGPGKPGRLSSVCFEVKPRSGNVVTQWSSIREEFCTGPACQLPHLLRSTTFFYDYGPFVSEVIGPNESICGFLGTPVEMRSPPAGSPQWIVFLLVPRR